MDEYLALIKSCTAPPENMCIADYPSDKVLFLALANFGAGEYTSPSPRHPVRSLT